MKLDTREFNRVLKEYLKVNQRDLATIFNTKAFYIARRSTLLTPKADRAEVEALRARVIGTGTKYTKTGKARKVTIRAPVATSRAAYILQAKARKEGKPAISSKDLPGAVRRFIGSRLRSIAFLKSGWLPAIKKLAPYADRGGAPSMDRSARQFGQPKGSATRAINGFRVRAEIINAASARGDVKGALIKYGEPALSDAFNIEIASMRDYIIRKMTQSARRLGIKTR